MSQTVKLDGLGKAIEAELSIYSDRVIEGIKNTAKTHMSQLVKATKATAPVGHRQKHYRDSITSSKTTENSRKIEYVWHVKGSDYRLSHLLERGHANRDGGRTPGTHFIEKAAEPILEDYLKTVEEVIKNG